MTALKLRNYVPRDKGLQECVLKPEIVHNVRFAIQKELSSYDDSEDQLGMMNLAPKKANWDLSRDLQPKMDQLKKRTESEEAEEAEAYGERREASEDEDSEDGGDAADSGRRRPTRAERARRPYLKPRQPHAKRRRT